MKRVKLDHVNDGVKQFFRALSADEDEQVLVLEGRAILRVRPMEPQPVDQQKLKEAILRGREASRKLNDEWQDADRDIWERNAGPER